MVQNTNAQFVLALTQAFVILVIASIYFAFNAFMNGKNTQVIALYVGLK